ncbi:MAG: hypothetical protein ABIJ96_15525 [Elusimicrobiota bacterium]
MIQIRTNGKRIIACLLVRALLLNVAWAAVKAPKAAPVGQTGAVPVHIAALGGLLSSQHGFQPALNTSLPSLAGPQSPHTLTPVGIRASDLKVLTVLPSHTVKPVETAAKAPARTLTRLQKWFGKSGSNKEKVRNVWDGGGFQNTAGAVSGNYRAPNPGWRSSHDTRTEAEKFTSVPGSVFDWKSVEDSPGHGIPPLDWLIRRIYGRKDSRFTQGFEMSNTARREDARVFLYGEKHTDKGLIAENFRRLAQDTTPGRRAVVMVEAYLGPNLFGSEALGYLAARGMDVRGISPEDVELRTWETPEIYRETSHSVLQHHMNQYDLNQLIGGGGRWFSYYPRLAAKMTRNFLSWFTMRRQAITRRNAELDKNLGAALGEAERTGGSVHLITGAEHLLERPLMANMPLLGGYKLRKSLGAVLGAVPYQISRPPDSPE